MNSTKNKILAVCLTCDRVKLVDRANYDIEGAIYYKTYCPNCEPEGAKESLMLYYDDNGFMNDREGIFDK